MDSKLLILSAALAILCSLYPLLLASGLQEHWYLPPTSKLLLLAGIVKLLLLATSEALGFNPFPTTARLRHNAGALDYPGVYSRPAHQQDVSPQHQHHNKGAAGHAQKPWSSQPLQLPQPGPTRRSASGAPTHSTSSFLRTHEEELPGDASFEGPSFSPTAMGASGWPLLLLLAAVCSTVADNITLNLLNLAPCYIVSQLAVLQVVAAVLLPKSGGCSTKAGSQLLWARGASLLLVLLGVCTGQGLVTGKSDALSDAAAKLESLQQVLPHSQTLYAATRPLSVISYGLAAALLSQLSDRCLRSALRRDSQQQLLQGLDADHTRRTHAILHTALGLAFNLGYYLWAQGDMEAFLDDLLPIHWEAVLLMAGASLVLSAWQGCQPELEAAVTKACTYQAAVALTTWGSSVLLGDVPQGLMFPCANFLSGTGILLLHSSMWQHSSCPDPTLLAQDRSCKGGYNSARSKGHPLLRRAWRRLRHILLGIWILATLTAVLLVGRSQVQQLVDSAKPLTFSHPASGPALAKLGIAPEQLQARSTAQFPAATLYLSTLQAAYPQNTTAPDVQHPPRSQARHDYQKQPTGTHSLSPAWSLCPVLNCSRHASCTARSPSCCAHLQLRMLAFWDAFMHSHGLQTQHVLLYDTLQQALDSSELQASSQPLHLGVSAAAAAVLESPCLKQQLWEHGYALFLQGSSWRLCAHRGHPAAAFTAHMHPTLHLTPSAAAGSGVLHPMWQLPGVSVNAEQQQKPFWSQSALGMSKRHPSKRIISRWRLCETGQVLTTAGDQAVLSGLRMQRPQQPGPIPSAIPAAGVRAEHNSTGGAAAVPAVTVCEQMISRLLVRTVV